MSRRSYAGGVQGVLLTAPVTDVATSLSVSGLAGVPTGAGGPFAVSVGKGTPNEEKMLVSSAGGLIMTISVRGYDGTAPKTHSTDEEVRLVHTAVDDDEANAHVNQTTGVHGLGVSDSLVGSAKVQTLTGKTMDGAANTFTGLTLAQMPAANAAILAETAARIAQSADRYTKGESDARYADLAAPAASIAAHLAVSDPHLAYVKGVSPSNRTLPPASLPLDTSGRYWGGPLTGSLTASDASPSRQIASLAVPAAPAGTSNRLLLVTLTVKGFTSNGADADVVRSTVRLGSSLPASNWIGYATAAPQVNVRLTGNLSVAANGISLSALFLADAGINTFTAFLEKISGAANITNHADGFLTAVQLA